MSEKYSPEGCTSKLDRFSYTQKERREYDRLLEEYEEKLADEWVAPYVKLEHIRHFVTTAGTYYIDRSEDWHDLPDLDARYRFYASIEKDLLNLIDDLAANHEFTGEAK